MLLYPYCLYIQPRYRESESMLCQIIYICTISPQLSLSWRLGFDYQIVVIGFLPSVMNICMRRVAPTLVFILELR